MGNTLGSVDPKAVKKVDAFLAKYPKLLSKELVSDNKLFKTYSFLVEGESGIIMKVYIKRDNTSLKKHEVSLSYMQMLFNLNFCPNLLPYTRLLDEADFAALIRPKVNLTLSQRLQTVPTLGTIEKYWIIFQLMTALYTLHQKKLYHGGINSNNVLLTTWNHAFLADFAWFAPNYLYEDVLGDINYYYPTASQKCNLAPEKFISRDYKDIANLEWFHENINEVGKISKETLPNLQKMDVFSLGCVIAEIMLDGTSLFKYEQLMAYRKGQYSPQEKMDRIKDDKVRKIIYDMIQKDPAQRKDITEVLKEWSTEVCPSSFTGVLYYLNSGLLSHNFVLPDQRIALVRELLEPIYQYVLEEPYVPHYQTLPIVIQQNQILRHFADCYQMVVPHFHEIVGNEKKLFDLETIIKDKLEFRGNIDPKNLRTIMTENKVIEKEAELNGHLLRDRGESKKPELLLVALMICSNIRNVRYFASLQVGLEMLTNFSHYFSDHINLHVIAPYLFSMLEDQNPKIVIATFHVLCDILSKLTKPIQYKSDKQLFETQMFPNLMKVYSNGDSEAKCAFVSRISQIINIGVVFITENVIFDYKIIKNQVESAEEAHDLPLPGDIEVKDDAMISKLQGENEAKLKEDIAKEVEKWKSSFLTYIQEIFSYQHSEVNEVLLRNFANLGEALGPKFTENFLVPHIVAALNDNRFRLISLEEIEKLIDFISEKTINGLLKPVLEKCMFDNDEINVYQSVKNIHKIIKLKKLDLKDTSFLVNNFLPLLIHPNSWIRELILELLCEAIEQMDVTSLYFKVHPALLKYVKKYEDLGLMNAELFRMVVVDPISRRAYEELRTKGSFNSVKEAQMIDLCAILNEHFLGNIHVDVIEFEIKKTSSRVLKKWVDPKLLKNIEDVVANFCIKTNAKHIKDLTRFGDKRNLSELIMIEADRDRNNQVVVIEKKENQLMSSFDIRDLRNQLTFRIPQLTGQHGIGHITYIKNLHNFYLFSANILGRRLQLQKKKNKDMGYHERYERPSYLNKEWEPQGFLIKTIYEHKDPVNCLDISTNSKLFASASEGGEIKIFDIPKLEADFSFNSLHTLNIKNEKNQEEFGNRSKIKTLKFLDEDSFVYGTDTGILEYHTLQEAGENQKSKARYRRWEVDGEVKAIQPLILGGQLKEKSFIYVTHKGELGIQDLNDKSLSIKFNLGKERGMISTMLASAMDYTIMIGTQRGHVLLYDIRANLLTSMYQLSSEAPILSFANYYPLNFGTPVSAQDALVGVAFGSDYHEVGFWNFSDFNKVSKNPEIYLYSSLNPDKECNPSYLKDVTKSESVFNIRSSFSDRRFYDYLAINAPAYNILSYFSDSIHQSQDLQRDKWLSQSKSMYRHANTAFKYRNSAHKLVCLPSFSPKDLRSKMVPAKELQNMVITAGNDMNIRYWNLSSDKFYHIYNVDGKKRSYTLTNTDMLIYQEMYSVDPDKTGFSPYQNKNGCSLNLSNNGEKHTLAQAGHKDTINDIVIAEKNELVITCSRDKTIKVWK